MSYCARLAGGIFRLRCPGNADMGADGARIRCLGAAKSRRQGHVRGALSAVPKTPRKRGSGRTKFSNCTNSLQFPHKVVHRLILGLPFAMVNWLIGAAAKLGSGEYRVMRVRATLVGAALLISTLVATSASATMRISDDVGGRIGAYVDQYSQVRNSGEKV